MSEGPGGAFASGITLGVTSGIACYKACDVLRELRRRRYRVRAILTESARRFVSADLFEALSNEPVGTSLFEARGLTGPYARYPHLFFARDISVFAVVPATYSLIGKLSGGIADDLLTTSLAATNARVLLVPAMNSTMYGQRALQENLARLRERGVEVLEPGEGELACGDVGEGRLPEVSAICDAIEALARSSSQLADWDVLVTAGPTREPLDPVRFVSNPSTGAMGYAMAAEAAKRGARVLLISGPTSLLAPPGVTVLRVNTHGEMKAAVLKHFHDKDAIVMAAAVGDYRASVVSDSKLKKREQVWELSLERTEDILAEVGLRREEETLLVGFALETSDVEEHARAKLREKGLDWVVANNPLEPGAGFGLETNRVTVLGRSGERVAFPPLPKSELAVRLWDLFLTSAPQRQAATS